MIKQYSEDKTHLETSHADAPQHTDILVYEPSFELCLVCGSLRLESLGPPG